MTTTVHDDADYTKLLDIGQEELVQPQGLSPSRRSTGFAKVASACCLLGLLGCVALWRPGTKHAGDTVVRPSELWNSPSNAPPIFRITATSPYDAGIQHGRLARKRIRAWFASDEMQSVFTWVAGRGSEAFAQLKADNTREFPTYVEEMRGIAEGAGVSMDLVWCANMMNDVENLMTIDGASTNRVKPKAVTSVATEQKGCSDEFAISRDGYAGGFAHGHNDDWSETARLFWYFVSVTAAPGASGVENCAGVAYPASLIGWAPSWNEHGMYHTQNTLLPRKSRPGSLAVAFVQKRAVCRSINMAQYITALTVPGWSDGASLNVVDLHGKKMANVELWEDRHSVQEVTDRMGNYSHFNEYKHLETARGLPIDDPAKFVRDLRQRVVDGLPAPRSTYDIMERLSNPSVYSQPGTLVTLVLNGTTGMLNVWCCGVTAMQAPEDPVYSWDLRNFF